MNRTLLFTIAAIGAGIGMLMPSGAEQPDRQAVEVAQASAGEDEEEDGEPRPTRIEREDDGHFYAHAKVNGELVRFLVDTGATGVALTIPTAERLGVPFSRSKFEVVATGASGPVRGQRITLDSVSVDGKRVSDVSGVVIEGLEISLLGQTYLSRIGSVEMSGNYMTLE